MRKNSIIFLLLIIVNVTVFGQRKELKNHNEEAKTTTIDQYLDSNILKLTMDVNHSQSIVNVIDIEQGNEFKTYDNGLIYSEKAMSKLGKVVDSLNLKFKKCEIHPQFYAKSQTIAYIVKLTSGEVQNAKKDMENNISFEEFKQKYPEAEITANNLILKRKYTNYSDEELVEFKHFDLKSDYGFRITSDDLKLYNEKMMGKWLFEYKNANESLKAFYFPDEFKSEIIPEKYSKMIGYSECLIDTNARKLKDNLETGWVELPDDWTDLPLKKKEQILERLRETRVVGGCSMDGRPRGHALNIALVSAETYNWDIFIKAHLDIMNDRFERFSDASYAQGARNTYIKELEELDINVSDLILGICFRIENSATNHYYGSINRIGRALSETKNKNEIEQSILSAVMDVELDDYNRLIFYYLFRNYIDCIEDEDLTKKNEEKLELAVNTLPEYYKKVLTQKKK